MFPSKWIPSALVNQRGSPFHPQSAPYKYLHSLNIATVDFGTSRYLKPGQKLKIPEWWHVLSATRVLCLVVKVLQNKLDNSFKADVWHLDICRHVTLDDAYPFDWKHKDRVIKKNNLTKDRSVFLKLTNCFQTTAKNWLETPTNGHEPHLIDYLCNCPCLPFRFEWLL